MYVAIQFARPCTADPSRPSFYRSSLFHPFQFYYDCKSSNWYERRCKIFEDFFSQNNQIRLKRAYVILEYYK